MSTPRSYPSLRRILLVRSDRLGDVLLATPMATALRRHVPDAWIAWLTGPYAAPLLEHNPDVNEVIVDEGGPAGALARRLRAGRYDVAVLASLTPRHAWATWRAGVPRRVGPLKSAWAALLSQPMRQRRSRARLHEADQNLELLRPLGVPFRRLPTRLELTEAERAAGVQALEALGCGGARRPLVVLHPGGGGSAPQWPPELYLELGRRLVCAGAAVLVTAGPGECFEAGAASAGLRFLPPGSVSVRELAGLLSPAALVVTNSTGPLHMAVALEVPTVSVYPGIGSAQAFRWGPYPAYPAGDPRHRVFVAPTGADGEADMGAVPVDAVWRECQERLGLVRV